ncbi:TolC family protein [Flavobacterium sp.]|uniref:TolC family protein n=1 Tax=Flavobacterium sp. TaxID=239 RepID=UPI0037531900
MKKISYTIILLNLVLFSYSQENLSLTDCFFIALKNNLNLKEEQFNSKISKTRVNAAKLKALPSINSSATNRYSWGRSIDPDSNSYIETKFSTVSGGIGSSFNLFSGFQNLNSIKQAKQDLMINKANYEQVENDLKITIASKYTSILFLQEIVKSLKGEIESTTKQLEMIELKFKAGYLSESEVYKVKSQLANLDVTLITTENDLDLNFLDLKQLLNIEVSKKVTLNPLINEDFTILELEKEEEFVSKNIEIYPMYQIFKLQLLKSKTEINLNRSALFPRITTNFNYNSFYTSSKELITFNNQINLNLNYSVGFSVSMPLFNQSQNRSKIKESKLIYLQNKVKLDLEKMRVTKILYQSVNDAKSAKKKYEAAKLNFEFSSKSYEADVLKFNYGKINFNDLSITKNNFLSSQSNLIKSKYEFLFNNALINFYKGNDFTL